MKGISEPIKRYDFDEKVEGRARYCADLHPEGMLYARTLRSDRPRAKILGITIPPLPDGYFIVDRDDIPGKNSVPIVYDDEPFLAREVVNYVGEPILLVVGPDKQTILNLLTAIRVDYEDLEPILTIEDALNCRENFIFQDRPHFVEYQYTKGDISRAIARAGCCIEDVFQTGYQEHVALETQSMLAVWEEGRIRVSGSMQCPYYLKDALVQALDWPEDRVRVVQLSTGGGFGGKEDYPSIVGVHAALAAVKSGRPVQLVLERGEDIRCTTKRHPAHIHIKSYLDHENHIIARDVEVLIDAGAYAGLSSVVLQRLIFSVCGVYRVDNLRVHGRAMATNNVVSGAFRGFGGPQAFFAIEMHMENIAQKLGVDSLEWKKAYFLRRGDTSSTGGLFQSEIVLPRIIEQIEEISGYSQKRRELSGRQGWHGIGCSVFFHGGGFTGKGEKDILKTRVRLVKRSASEIEIRVANTEIGQGAATTLRKIVARALEIPVEHVAYIYPDTDLCPDSGPTIASRTIMIIGKLLYDCALEMKEKWQEETLEVTRGYTYPAGLSWDNARFIGNAYAEYSWGANVVEVEVNPLTLEINVLGVWAVYDIGTPIDERIVKGQIDGGLVQGLGYAGMELLQSRRGKLQQGSLADYIIPTFLDFPPIVSRLVENPYENGPFGARGLGEITLVGAAPALALAVQNAVGQPVRQLPVSPEYLMELICDE